MATVSSNGARTRPGLRRALVWALALGAASGAARADLWVKEKLTGGDGKALGERTWSFAPGKIRLDDVGAGFLIDATNGHAWIFGDGLGCEALPFPVVVAAGATPAAPNQREARLAAILAELGGGPFVLLPRHEKRTIARVEADRWDVTNGSEVVQERWIASSVRNPDLEAIVGGLSNPAQLSTLMALPEAQVLIQTVGLGYAVRVKVARTGSVAEAVEIRTAKLGAAAFTPPPGCAER